MGLNYCNYFTHQLILTLVRARTGAQRYLYSHSIVRRNATSTSTKYRPVGLSTSTKLRDAKLFGRFTQTDENRAVQYLAEASMADRIYSKPYSRVQKHREQNDGPKSSIVPTFSGCPIPSDLVIVNVRHLGRNRRAEGRYVPRRTRRARRWNSTIYQIA